MSGKVYRATKIKTFCMQVISLGLGVQSTAMYYMSCLGELPRADLAIFADTGGERAATLQYLDILQQWSKDNQGIVIEVVRAKNLFYDLLHPETLKSPGVPIPAFTDSQQNEQGILQRRCTGEYKVKQFDMALRQYLGVKRIVKQVEVWKGISLDEIERMTEPYKDWKVNVYPFCGYQVTTKGAVKMKTARPMTRATILTWYQARKFPVPVKSACCFCPYRSDHSWADLKKNYPEDFEKAVQIDQFIRDSKEQEIKTSLYLHKSLQPLDQVNFDRNQPDFWGECSDNCHL
jgi:hypothetical protein